MEIVQCTSAAEGASAAAVWVQNVKASEILALRAYGLSPLSLDHDLTNTD